MAGSDEIKLYIILVVIIIFFLISDEESQFTAHIIFDLIADKTFLYDSQYLSDILYNSLHWKIQKIFKVNNYVLI